LYNDIRKFKSLKFIQLTSVGVDRIPVDYIRKKGIKLFNAQDAYSVPMAEWVVLKILEIYKCSKRFYKNQADKIWEKQRDLLELTDKTVAIIGFGNVGNEVAKRIKAFNTKIIGVDIRKIRSELLDEFYFVSDIDEVLRKSDIVILTLPLTDRTKHFINKDRISNMKNKCVLVNVSRGEIIDEEALLDAIRNDRFLGVALDVLEQEPLSKENPLWDMERVIITPHNSFISDKIYDRLFKIIYNNLQEFIVKDRCISNE